MKIDPLTKSRNQQKEMRLRNKKINEYQKEFNRQKEIRIKKKRNYNKLKCKLMDESLSNSKKNRLNYIINSIGLSLDNSNGMCRYLETKINRMKN